MDPSPPAATEPARQLRPGTRLGRYTLLCPLGHGGMAELYLASNAGPQGFRKRVVLKLVLPHLAADKAFIEMFVNEARIAGLLDHPNIAAVYELGRDRGEYFFAMEHVDGHDLRSLLSRSGGGPELPLDCALAIVVHIASALDYAHQARDATGKPLKIVHRDVSPSNILVRYDGCVKLVDFGIAKAAAEATATRSGVLKGKVGYMSPEQCLGETIDCRSDVFALGVVLYEVTTNRRLFFGDNEFATMNRVVRGELAAPSEVRPGYPAELERIVLRALKTDPQARYPTAAALRSDLEAFAHAQRLRLSESRLAAWMQATGRGEPTEIDAIASVASDLEAQPRTPDEPRLEPARDAEAPDEGSRRSSRLAGALRMAAAVGVGAALAVWMMDPAPAAVPAPAGASSEAEPPAPPPSAMAAPAVSIAAEASPNRAHAAAPVPEEPTTTHAPTPDAGAPEAEAPPARRTTATVKKRRTKQAKGRNAPSAEALDAMFPGGS